jgi:ABC-type transporter Mla subunit MlaD
MHDPYPSDTAAAQAISQLGDSIGQTLAQTAQSQRALIQDITAFARDESLRFANLRLDRNGQALDKLQHCHGVPGILGVQQEWLRDLMQDYLGQQMRLAGAFRGLAQNAMSSASELVSENFGRMQQHASEAMQQTGEAMDQAVQNSADIAQQAGEHVSQMAQDVENAFQETQH